MAADTPQIFISYRRADSAANVGRLFDWLTRQFGEQPIRFDDVFVDTDGIQPGDDFVEVLQQRLATADIVLVIIGPQWLSIANANGRRLDQANDFVRLEVAGALAAGKRVIPVLVGGAAMPSAEQLPEPLRALATRNAIAIDDALHSFANDFDRLVDAILQRTRSRIETEVDRLRVFARAIRFSSLAIPLVAVLLLLALWLGMLEALRIDVYASSIMQTVADRMLPDEADPGVAIVALDWQNLLRLQQAKPRRPDAIAAWYDELAIWRRNAARLIDRLVSLGAKTIVFDVYFEEQTDADSELASAIRHAQAKNVRVVVGAKRLASDGGPDIAPALRGTAEWGSVCISHRFGQGHMVALAMLDPSRRGQEIQPGSLPALALRALSADPQPGFAIEARSILLADRDTRPARFSLVKRIRRDPDASPESACNLPPSGSDAAMLLIRLPAPGYWHDNRRRLSMERVLNGDIEPAQVIDKIVLIGGLAGDGDLHSVADGTSRRAIYGVELQANAMVDLLHGRELKRPTLGTNLILILLLAAAGTVVGYLGAAWARWRRRALLGALLVGYLLLALALAVYGWLLPILYHISAFAILYLMLQRLRVRSFQPGPALT